MEIGAGLKLCVIAYCATRITRTWQKSGNVAASRVAKAVVVVVPRVVQS